MNKNIIKITAVFTFFLSLSLAMAGLGLDNDKVPRLEAEENVFIPAGNGGGGNGSGNVSGGGVNNRIAVWDSATTITSYTGLNICTNSQGDKYFCYASSTDMGVDIFSVHGGTGFGINITDDGNVKLKGNILCALTNTCYLGTDVNKFFAVYSSNYHGSGQYLTDICLTNKTACNSATAYEDKTNTFTVDQTVDANLYVTGKEWIGDTGYADAFTDVSLLNVVNGVSAYTFYGKSTVGDSFAVLQSADSATFYFYQRNGGYAGQTSSGGLSWDIYGGSNSMFVGQNDGDVYAGGTITSQALGTGARLKIESTALSTTLPLRVGGMVNATIGNFSVDGFVRGLRIATLNASNELVGTVNCLNITGGSDADYCTDSGGSGNASWNQSYANTLYLPINISQTKSINITGINTTNHTVYQQVFTFNTRANNNYTLDCILYISSNHSTNGVQLNISTNETAPVFSIAYNHPTSSTATVYNACVNTKQCIDASTTSFSTPTTPAPVKVVGTILTNSSNLLINISYKSEQATTFSLIARGSYCKMESFLS